MSADARPAARFKLCRWSISSMKVMRRCSCFMDRFMGYCTSRLSVVLLLLLGGSSASAADVDVRTANIRKVEDAWTLTARVDYRLPEEPLEALENGVTLSFRVEVVVERVRGWWLDAEMFTRQLDWQLSFDPLTQRYLLRYPDSREPTSHGTLFGALNALGRLQSLPIAPADALDAGETYDVAVRAVLDEQRLPSPLQVLAFWNGGFSLASDWYQWTMGP